MPEHDDDRPDVEVVDLLAGATPKEVDDFLVEQLVDRILQPDPGPYPYVVTRHFPAVYTTKRVSWSAPGEPGQAVIRSADPYDGEGALRQEARELVIAYAVERAAATGFKHCAVFGERDAVYVEPDGTTSASTQPPMWGRSLTA